MELILYLGPSHHHQAGSNFSHHSADQLGLPHTWRPHQEHASGTQHTQRAQGAWIEEGHLQHLSQGCTHLKYHKKHISHRGNKQCGWRPIQWLHTDLLQTPQWDRVLVLQLTPVVPDCPDAAYLHTSFWGDDSGRPRIHTDAFNNNVSDLCVKILQVYHVFLVQAHTFQHVLHELMNLSRSGVFLKLNTLDHHSDLHAFQFGAGYRCELGRVQSEMCWWVRDETGRGTLQVQLQEALRQVRPGPRGAQAASPGDRHQQGGAQTQTQRWHQAWT